MNKLFTKIAGLSIGLAMAIGVGVAVASNSKEATPVHADTIGNWVQVTALNQIAVGDKIVIVTSYNNTKYYMNNSVNKGHFQAGTFTSSLTNTANGVITLESTGTANRYLLASTGSTGYVTASAAKSGSGAFSASDSSGWNFSLNGSDWDIVYNSNSAYLRAYQNSFRTYAGRSNDAPLIYKYSASYTLSFNANGGSGTVPSNITGSGSKTLPSSASITKTGYTLDGWGDSSHKDNASAQYALGAAYTLSADITLYAHWTPNKYSVSASITYGTFTGATGANAATYGTAYNATISANTNYVLPDSLTVTMGGVATNAYTYNSSTGAFQIASPTGNISISGECVPDGGTEYVFSYELSHCSITDAPESMYDSQIKELQIVPDEHYKLPAEDANKVSVTGAVDWYYDEDDGTITIDGAEDDLTVTVECVAKAQNTISMGTLTGVSQADGNPTSVEEGATVTLTFTANEGYGLPTSSGVTVTGTGSSSTWTQGTGKLQITGGTGNITVSITGIVRSVTSISLSSNSGSYALGDTFTMPTVTANYNVGASEDVTASATATGGGLENGVLTSTGTKTITISYGGQSATYTATVTAIKPSAGGLEKITKLSDLTAGSTVYLVCEDESKQLSGISTTSTKYGLGADYSTAPSSTVYPLTVETGYSSGTYSFKNGDNYLNWSSSNSLSTNSTLSDNTSWTVTFNSSGNALLANKATPAREIWWNTSSPRFACYTDKTEQSTGYAPVQLYKNYPAVEPELKWITAEVKSGTYYQGSSVTASDFTVTAHYDDGNTSTPTTDITVTNGELNNIGANEVTITYGGKSCKVTVTAVEQTATLTGLAWAQGEYTIIDGQGIDFSELGTITAEYDDGDEYTTKSIAQCSVATYTKNGNNYVKVADLDDGDEITFASHGKYLGVSYTEGLVTEYAYSSAPIYVVEAINDVYGKEETYTWSKTTSISDGDVVTFVNESEKKVASSYGSNLINSTSYDSSISNPMTFTVGKVGDYYTFHNSDGYLGNHSTGTSGNNYAYLDQEIDTTDNKNYFTVTFDNGNVIIKSVYDNDRVFQLRNGTPDRFCFYGSTQLSIQLYKGETEWVPTGDSIANTNAVAQKVVLEYAVHFNETMDCVAGGTTANVSAKWADLAGDFDDWFNNGDKDLTPSQVTHAFALFAGADAVEDGDTLQDMLARYEYICRKYSLNDFLANVDRPPVSQAKVNPILIGINHNSSAVIIIVVFSAISLAAIGGYFLFHKKKEN